MAVAVGNGLGLAFLRRHLPHSFFFFYLSDQKTKSWGWRRRRRRAEEEEEEEEEWGSVFPSEPSSSSPLITWEDGWRDGGESIGSHEHPILHSPPPPTEEEDVSVLK